MFSSPPPFEAPPPLDLEKALLLVELGDDSHRFSEAVHLLVYLRELAECGYEEALREAVLALTEVPRGA